MGRLIELYLEQYDDLIDNELEKKEIYQETINFYEHWRIDNPSLFTALTILIEDLKIKVVECDITVQFYYSERESFLESLGKE